MDAFVLIAVMLAMTVFAFGWRLKPVLSRLRSPRNQKLPLDKKLEVLAECGFALAEPFTLEELLSHFSRQEYEKPGYVLLVMVMGFTEEREPWRNLCTNLWNFDTECIEDRGDYAVIVKRMSELTQRSMVLENVEDDVDLENEVASFSFDFRGKRIKVDCRVDTDWVDTTIFAKFVELLAVSDPSKIFVYFDLGGQNCLIGCVTKTQLEKLESHAVKFVPLS